MVSLALQVPVVMKDNKARVSDTFINDVFQSMDQFSGRKRPHLLNAPTADEIKQAEIVKACDFNPILFY